MSLLTPQQQERLKRVKACTRLLRRGCYDHDIIWRLSEKFSCQTQTIRRDLNIARRLMRHTLYGLRDSEDLACQNALMLLDGLIQDSQCPHAVKLGAIAEKNRILGLHKLKAEIQMQAQVTNEYTMRSIVEVARESDEVRMLMLKMNRALPKIRGYGQQASGGEVEGAGGVAGTNGVNGTNGTHAPAGLLPSPLDAEVVEADASWLDLGAPVPVPVSTSTPAASTVATSDPGTNHPRDLPHAPPASTPPPVRPEDIL